MSKHSVLKQHKKEITLVTLVAVITWIALYSVIMLSTPFLPAIPELPTYNAFFNFCALTSTLIGVVCVKQKRISLHRFCMLLSLLFSACFLVGYLLSHATIGERRFLGEGFVRWIYFFILITHILATGILLPFLLNAFYFALSSKIHVHRILAPFTYKLWAWVSFSGIMIYLFLR